MGADAHEAARRQGRPGPGGQKWTGLVRSRVAYGQLSKTRKLLRRLPDELTAPVRAAVREVIEKMRADAIENAPVAAAPYRIWLKAAGKSVLVQPGRLQGAIRQRISRDGFAGEVGLIGKRSFRRGFHGYFAEYGSKHHPARPWLRPAFDAGVDKARGAIAAAVNRAIRQAALGAAAGHVAGAVARVGV